MSSSQEFYNGVSAPSMILGTFQHSNEEQLSRLVRLALRHGFKAFDTAPSYQNEQMLGDIFSSLFQAGGLCREQLFLIDKIDGWQMEEAKGCIRPYAEEALRQLQVDYLDLLLIHWPFPNYLLETWLTFEELYREGLVRSIGMCNVHPRHLESLAPSMSVVPHVIQTERHPLYSADALVTYCQKQQIAVQAYSPVCRMHPRVADSIVLQQLAQKYDKTKGQIIMRWHLDKGVAPVFMTTREERLVEYGSQLHNFALKDADVAAIDAMNEDYKLFLESWACPGY